MDIQSYIRKQPRRLLYPQMGAFGLKYTSYTMYEVYNDPLKQLEIAKIIEDTVPMDFSYPVDYGVVFVESLGLKLKRPDFDFPSTYEHPVRCKEDVRRLVPPDPHGNVLMQKYLQSIELIAKEIRKPEMVALVGPFTLAGELAGVDHLARSLLKEPEFVETLLEFCSRIIVDFILETISCGASVIQISEPTASIISPKLFRQFVRPYLESIFDKVHEQNIWSVLHICGKTTLYLDDMVNTGVMVLSLDQIMNLPDVAGRVPDNVAISGNIDPVETMLMGTPEVVAQATTELLDSMRHVPLFMPSLGCDCIMATPEANVLAFMNSVLNAT